MSDSKPVHSLSDLISTFGPATDEELQTYFRGVDDAYLVDWGREVATPRIGTDAPHIVGEASVFLAGASDTQLDWLGGVTKDTLRLGAWAAHRANELHRSRVTALKASRGQKDEHAAVSEQVVGKAASLRDVLEGMLRTIASAQEPLRSRVGAAYSKSLDPLELADTLDKLIALGREMLGNKAEGVVKRRATTRLSKAWLDNALEVSTKLRAAGEHAGAVRTVPTVTQSDVDLHDGWALMLLDQIVSAFDRGHAADPTIPRLAVYSLRVQLRPPSGKRAKPAPTEPTPVVPTGES